MSKNIVVSLKYKNNNIKLYKKSESSIHKAKCALNNQFKNKEKKTIP